MFDVLIVTCDEGVPNGRTERWESASTSGSACSLRSAMAWARSQSRLSGFYFGNSIGNRYNVKSPVLPFRSQSQYGSYFGVV